MDRRPPRARPVSRTPGGRVCARALIAVLAGAFIGVASPVPAAAARGDACPPARLWTAAEAAKQRDALVEATLLDPIALQQPVPGSGSPPFVRHRWRLRVDAVVEVVGVARATTRTRPAALRAGAVIIVDEPRWRDELALHRRCQAGDCRPHCPPAMASRLARPPRPGQRVRASLRWHGGDGWALVAERAFDEAAGSPAAPGMRQ